jgi:polar amino acid transport system substrate-binding protein
MDGYDAAKEIRRIDPKVPIIAVSANAMTGDIEKTRQYGMNEHLNKPVDVEKLFSLLLTYIPGKCGELQTGDPADPGPEAMGLCGFKSVNTKAGLRQMMGDRALYTKILRDFSENYDGVAKKLSRSINCDKEEAKRIIHTIKGLSAGIGAEKLHEAAVRFDESLAPGFFDPFVRELERVVDEIKKSTVCRNDPPLAVNEKKPLSECRRKALMQALVKALEKRRPRLIGPVLDELNAFDLKGDDVRLLEKISSLVKQYKFKDVLDLLAPERK